MTSITLSLALALAAMTTWGQAQALSCQELPRAPIPSNQAFVAGNPYKYDHVLTSALECATRVFVQPAGGATTYTGSTLDIEGKNVISHDYTVDPINRQTDVLTGCEDGTNSTWYFQYTDLTNPFSASYCAYSCNGTALAEYRCVSNNNGTSCIEEEALNVARTVPNGDQIHPAQANCPLPKACHTFY